MKLNQNQLFCPECEKFPEVLRIYFEDRRVMCNHNHIYPITFEDDDRPSSVNLYDFNGKWIVSTFNDVEYKRFKWIRTIVHPNGRYVVLSTRSEM